MKIEKQLLNEFQKLYLERQEYRGWENRKLINVLMKDVAQIITESWSQNKNLKIPDFNNKWPVKEAKPNSGKSTMLVDVSIPVLSTIAISQKIFPIWILVNPTSDILKSQTTQLVEGMVNGEPIVQITFDGKKGVEQQKQTVLRARDYFGNTRGLLIVINQAMINEGIDKGCKPYTMDLLITLVKRIQKDKPKYKIALHPLHDECRISSASTDLNAKMASKNPFPSRQSYMKAQYEFYESVLHLVDNFQVIGFDATPKYHQVQQVPLRKEAVLPLLGVEKQDDDWSVLTPYGGGEDIWEPVPLSEDVPKSETTLDDSYFSGPVKIVNFGQWNIGVDEAYNFAEELTAYNKKQAEKYNEDLEKYDVKINSLKRMALAIGGADDEEDYHKFVKGEQELARYLQDKRKEHILLTDDSYYYMDNDGNKYDDLSQGMVEEYVDGIKDDGILFAILKRKRQMGWNCPQICCYIGLSEHTDMMKKDKNLRTAKNFESQAQSVSRSVRMYTALITLDGKALTVRDAQKLIVNLKNDQQYKLADVVFDLVKTNNQFKVWYMKGESDVHDQLNVWLQDKYSDENLFLKMFQTNDKFHSLECTCGNCPIHDFKNQKIDEEKVDKNMPEISEKLDDIVDVISKITPKINPDPDVPEQRI